jgi:hypothetical protein
LPNSNEKGVNKEKQIMEEETLKQKHTFCDILALVDGDILDQDLIELIEHSYQQGASSFSKASLERTSRLSVLGLEQFKMSDRPRSLLGCA